MTSIGDLILSFGFLIIAITVHEFSHGFVAYKLGDNTAKYSGRLSLNPLAHIDPFGTIILPILLYFTTGGRFVFGYAKPVPVNTMALGHPKRDIGFVSLAGPLSNITFAFLLSLLVRFLHLPGASNYFLVSLININVILGVFNLLPIPPLDGSGILISLLPQRLAIIYSSLERYGFILLIVLILFNITDYFVWPLVRLILNFMLGGVSI
ncbi:MAG: site-2 protease family protein [Candidatus Omnitrophica bacterium]|jgi:Zn-dependent protease|nr:site-2 protease family protein [Candidatus Omnitrophota bacterium]